MKIVKKTIDLFNKYKEIITYLIFGVLTTLVSLLVYYGLTFTIINPKDAIMLQVANMLSWVAGVTFAYVTNRKYVFNSKNTNIKKELVNFVSSRVVTLILDMTIMGVFVTLLGFNDKIIKIISQVLVIIGNYVFSKLFVFKKEK